MNTKDRLLQFLKYAEMGQTAFENKVGWSRGHISKIKGAVGSDMIAKIAESFPELNIDWLITGKGNMLKKETDQLVKINAEGDELKGVPYYENVEATCGIISQFNDYPETPTFFINYEHFNDCTAYIPVVGDSMYPQYCAGEIVAVKRIFNLDIIQWGEAYFVVTNENSNSLKTIKQVHWCEDPSKIILRASNPNYKGDTLIDKADIISMFIIKGKIKRNQL